MNYRETDIIMVNVTDVSPKYATQLLSKNAGNRAINAKRVKQYMVAMQRGEWMMTGQPIIITDKGILIDGQHRLEAIVLAKVSVKLFIITIKAIDDKGELSALNVPIDLGYARSTSNITGISPKATSTVKQLIRLLESGGQVSCLNPSVVIDRYNQIKDIVDYVVESPASRYSKAPMNAGVVMAYLMGYDIIGEYNNVARSKYTMLPERWGSWMRYVDSANSGGMMQQREWLASIIHLAKTDAPRFTLRASSVENIIKEARELYKAVMLN